jgi:polyhydroxybutyrate depolymerase
MMRTTWVLLLTAACGSVEATTDGAILGDAGVADGALAEIDATPATADAGVTDPPPPSNVLGKHEHELVVDALDREVIVYVPSTAVGPTPVPVVFMFHGASGDGERFYDNSGWREKADQVGFIAVFPTALHHCLHADLDGDGQVDDEEPAAVMTRWTNSDGVGNDRDTLLPCSAAEIAALPPAKKVLADHPIADDLAYTRAVLDLLSASYAVDPRRIYASGFSNGGGFTSRLAVAMPNRFAAIAASSGFLVEDKGASLAVPVAFTVGSKDPGFTAAMNVAELPVSEQLIGLAGWKTMTVVPYLEALALDDSYVFDELALAGGLKGARFSYLESDRGASNGYVHMVIEDLGHEYANGTNHPVVYANMFWEFFKLFALPE